MREVMIKQFHEDYISNHPSFTGILIDYRKIKLWYRNGKRHREDGPAVEHADGSKAWYQNGKRHREDGPAVESPSGTKWWWLHGEMMTEEEHKRRVRKKKLEAFLDGDN